MSIRDVQRRREWRRRDRATNPNKYRNQWVCEGSGEWPGYSQCVNELDVPDTIEDLVFPDDDNNEEEAA